MEMSWRIKDILFEITPLPVELCEKIAKIVFIDRMNKFKMDNYSVLYFKYKSTSRMYEDDKSPLPEYSLAAEKYNKSMSIHHGWPEVYRRKVPPVVNVNFVTVPGNDGKYIQYKIVTVDGRVERATIMRNTYYE